MRRILQLALVLVVLGAVQLTRVFGPNSNTAVATTDSSTPSPGAVSDLAVSAVGPNTVTLTWTEVDDGTGQPADYEVRHRRPGAGWAEVLAGSCASPVAGVAIGAEVRCDVAPLAPETPYEFQVQAFREPTTPPADTTTPPPSGPDEPAATDPGASPLFDDNFDAHASPADMVEYWDDGTTGLELVAGRGGSGQAWRTTYRNEQDWYLLRKNTPAQSRRIYLSFWFRFQHTDGSGMSDMPTAGLKFLWWDHEDRPTPTIRTLYVDPDLGSPPLWEVEATLHQGTYTAQGNIGHYQWDIVHGTGPHRGGFHEAGKSYSDRLIRDNDVGGVPSFAQYADTGWHRITIEVVTSEGVTTAGYDGYSKTWLDGVLKYDDTNRSSPILYYARPTQLSLPANVSSGAMAPFHLDIDDLVIWTR